MKILIALLMLSNVALAGSLSIKATATSTGPDKTLSNLESPTAISQDLILRTNKIIKLNNTANTFFTAVRASSDLTSSTTFILPAADGTSGQVLQTNGAGFLSFITPAAAGANTALSNLASTAINAFGFFF